MAIGPGPYDAHGPERLTQLRNSLRTLLIEVERSAEGMGEPTLGSPRAAYELSHAAAHMRQAWMFLYTAGFIERQPHPETVITELQLAQRRADRERAR